MGIEPTRPAWKAGILPLNYTPQMLCLTLTLNYYNTFILICQGLFAIIFNFLQNIWAVEFLNRFLVVFRLKITPRKS